MNQLAQTCLSFVAYGAKDRTNSMISRETRASRSVETPNSEKSIGFHSSAIKLFSSSSMKQRTSQLLQTSAFFKEFSLGGWGGVKIALKYGMSNLRLPQPVHLSGASWGGYECVENFFSKGFLEEGKFFLLYICLRCILVHFQFKICRKKSKKHILGKHNQTDLVSAAWREVGKKSKFISGKNHTSVI